jgi:hypothetical protein
MPRWPVQAEWTCAYTKVCLDSPLLQTAPVCLQEVNLARKPKPEAGADDTIADVDV